MNNIWLSRGTRALLFVTAIGVAGGSNRGRPQEPLTKIHVRLTDLAALPEKLRAQSERLVEKLFANAGVALDFVECDAPTRPCTTPPASCEYWVQILRQRPLHLDGDSAGFAVLVPSRQSSDSYAAVWFPKVEDAARDFDAPIADVLAATLAHEIGHLALHSSAHSPTGLMKPRLDRKQIELMGRGELAFTPAETARLAERLASLAK
jgi:hypothetical protein